MVILCVDLSLPASVAPCLFRWTSTIQAHVTSFSGQGRRRLDSLKEGVAASVRQQRGGGAGGEALPLPEGVLQHSELFESLLPECNDSPSHWQVFCLHPSILVWFAVAQGFGLNASFAAHGRLFESLPSK